MSGSKSWMEMMQSTLQMLRVQEVNNGMGEDTYELQISTAAPNFVIWDRHNFTVAFSGNFTELLEWLNSPKPE